MRKDIYKLNFLKREWIASIDSDIFVYHNWWEEIHKHIHENVGGISGFINSDFEKILPMYEKYTKFFSLRRYEKTGRGGTIGNVLIKRKLILQMKEDLTKVHAGEDRDNWEKYTKLWLSMENNNDPNWFSLS